MSDTPRVSYNTDGFWFLWIVFSCASGFLFHDTENWRWTVIAAQSGGLLAVCAVLVCGIVIFSSNSRLEIEWKLVRSLFAGSALCTTAWLIAGSGIYTNMRGSQQFGISMLLLVIAPAVLCILSVLGSIRFWRLP